MVGLSADPHRGRAVVSPLYDVAGGDVSRYLPAFLWSADADGKDQIILASVASTFLLPVIVAALVLVVVKRIVTIGRQRRG